MNKETFNFADRLKLGLPSQHIEKKQGYSYVGHTYMISQLNDLFGFDGWDIEQLGPVQVVHKEQEDGKWHVICTAAIRLTVRGPDGFKTTFREDVGTCGNKGKNLTDVLNTAWCGAPTFALKRAAHWFGNNFGSSLYDSTNPVHHGGEDKWGFREDLTEKEVDMVIQSFRHDLDGAENRQAFDGVMSKYVLDLKRLPDDDRSRMRELSKEKLEQLKEKTSNA